MKQQIKSILKTGREKYVIYRAKKFEINKFRDPRRVSIHGKINLMKEQQDEIDTLYKHYGKKIPHTWHRHYTAFTGNFDKSYFPELLYIPEFEYYMTPHQEYCCAFEDKNVISIIAAYAGVKTPEVILSGTAGIYRDAVGNLLTRECSSNILSVGGVLCLLSQQLIREVAQVAEY